MHTLACSNPWLPYTKPKQYTRMRLFCFPYAGSGASIFRTWANLLPPEVEVCPVQLPGRESRFKEPLFTQLMPLCEELAQALDPFLRIPFAFFGHSMGALVSFELARYLRRADRPNPLHLFVSAHCAPQLVDNDLSTHGLPEAEFVQVLRSLNGTPEMVLQNSQLLQLMLPILRADFAMCETYMYAFEDPLNCSISAFGGIHDYKVPCERLEGWREQTRGAFSLRMFPGDHFFLNSNQVLLLQALSQNLTNLVRQLG